MRKNRNSGERGGGGRPPKKGRTGDKKNFTGRKTFSRTSGASSSFKRDDDKGERRTFQSERGIKNSGEARSDKPFRPKSSERKFDKPFDKKKSFGKGDRDSFRGKRSEGSDSRPARKFDKPFDKKRSFDKSDRSSFRDKRSEGSDSRPARKFDKPFDKKRSFDKSDRSSFRGKRSEGSDSRPARKFDKPFEKKKSFGRDDGDSIRTRRSEGSDSRSLENKIDKPFEERKPFVKKDREPFLRRKRVNDDSQGDFKKKENDREDRPWNRKEKHSFYGDRRTPKAPPVKKEDDGSTRLNKYISNAGICSRREADELIAAGVVSVNGNVITEMGFKVMPGDVVKYNNEQLRSERLVYILLNKPKDFITTTDDPEDRKTVMSLIAKACKERVYPVGRLDRNTTGLLLFTNDGDLAKKLTHPSFQVHKVYQVELDRALKSTDMDLVSQGISLDDGLIKPDEIAYVAKEKNVIGIELHSGKNRIVRRIFEHLGYDVKKLDRVIFAGLTKKDLPRGRWRFLTDMEIAGLKMLSGKGDKMER